MKKGALKRQERQPANKKRERLIVPPISMPFEDAAKALLKVKKA